MTPFDLAQAAIAIPSPYDKKVFNMLYRDVIDRSDEGGAKESQTSAFVGYLVSYYFNVGCDLFSVRGEEALPNGKKPDIFIKKVSSILSLLSVLLYIYLSFTIVL